MTTIGEARSALAEVIRSGTGLRCLPYLSDTVPAPCGILRSMEFDPRYVLGRATAVYEFQLRTYVGHVAEVDAQRILDELRDPTGGVTSAVEDESLWPANLVQSAYVTLIGATGEIQQVADESFMVCDFNIEVIF